MKTTNRREGILSKTEYDIMSIIWDINHSVSAREIYDLLPEPKPAYTTLATEMRTLYEKGFVDHFKKDGEALVRSITAEGPIEAALMLMREIGMPVELVKYRQLVVPEKDKLWAGRGLSRMLLKAGDAEVEGRGVSSDTLKANMRALFGGVNLLYKKA